MKAHKKNMVYSRLARRLRALGLKSFTDYLLYLSGTQGEEEIGSLINAVTTNLTKFFRENHHFDHLNNIVFPTLLNDIHQGGEKRIRLWSAGCSSGEEPYGMAMALDRALNSQNIEDIDARILATDLDTNMLQSGRDGIYKNVFLDDIDEKYHGYFEPSKTDSNLIHVSSQLRKYIAFKKLNLILNWPIKGPFDAIFCRNVMIYFDNKTKAELTRKFVQLLKPGGWLFIGHSETILGADDQLKLYGRTIYQRAN